MAEAPQEVLTIRVGTAPKRRRISIDDESFELIDMRELNLAGKAVAIRVSNSLVAFGKGELDDVGIAALRIDLNTVISMVVPGINKPHAEGGKSALETLSDDDKCSIVLAFCAPRRTPAPLGGEAQPQPAGAS